MASSGASGAPCRPPRSPGAPAGSSLLDSVLLVSPADSATAGLVQTHQWSYQVKSATEFTVTACRIDRTGVAPTAGPGRVNYVAYPAG